MKKADRRSSLLFIVSFIFLLYPGVSELVNRMHYSYLTREYVEETFQMSADRCAALINEAVTYNAMLNEDNFLRPDEKLDSLYGHVLDQNGTGMIGTIRIYGKTPEIPIYHTTEEGVLQKGVGHVKGSSFPVFGDRTHCILAGHTGLRHARIFTDLAKVQTGDIFRIRILDTVSDYEVDDIRTVLPEDTDFLKLEEGKEYCSLITCTPYGINSHRLVIRGTRIQ